MLLVVTQWADGDRAATLSAADGVLLVQVPPVPQLPQQLTPPSDNPGMSDPAASHADTDREDEDDNPELLELDRKESARIRRELISRDASVQSKRATAKSHLRKIVATLEDGRRPGKELEIAFLRSALALFDFPEGQRDAAEEAKARFLDALEALPTDEGDKPDAAEVLNWLRIQACLCRVDVAESARQALSTSYESGRVSRGLTEARQRSILAKAGLGRCLLDRLLPRGNDAAAIAAKDSLRTWLHLRCCEESVDCASFVWAVLYEKWLGGVSPTQEESQAREQLCAYLAQWLAARRTLGASVKPDEVMADCLSGPLKNVFVKKALVFWRRVPLEGEEHKDLKALRDSLEQILSGTVGGRSPSGASEYAFSKALLEVLPLGNRDPVVRDAKTTLLSSLATEQSQRQANRLFTLDQRLRWLEVEALLHRWAAAELAWEGNRNLYRGGRAMLDSVVKAHDRLAAAKLCFAASALDNLPLVKPDGEARAARERIWALARVRWCEEAHESALETWDTVHEKWEEGAASSREEAFARERVHGYDALRQAALAFAIGDMPTAGLRTWTLQDGRTAAAAMVGSEPPGRPVGPGTSLALQGIDGNVCRVAWEQLSEHDQRYCLRCEMLLRRLTKLDPQMSGSPDWTPVKKTLKIVLDAASTHGRVRRETQLAFLQDVIGLAPLATGEDPTREIRESLLAEAAENRDDAPMTRQEAHRWQEVESQLNRVLAAQQESASAETLWKGGVLYDVQLLDANERLLAARTEFGRSAFAAASGGQQDNAGAKASGVLLAWLDVGVAEMGREEALRMWASVRKKWQDGVAPSSEEAAMRERYYRVEANSLAAWARASRCGVLPYSYEEIRQHRMRDDPDLKSAAESLRQIEAESRKTD